MARLRAREAAQFSCLPNADWMLCTGCEAVGLGLFPVAKYGAIGVMHKVEVLAQTAMVFLFRNDCFVAGQPLESEEQFLAFLQAHRFPIPPCA